MRRISALIGMPVVLNNRKIGRVLQAELDGDLTHLTGVWIGPGLWGARFIPAESLELIGSVAILADDPGRRRHISPAPLFQRAVSTDGRRLGAITGAEIDELSFNVTALELSRGIWDDLILKRDRITRYAANRKTGEIIIDPADSAREGDLYEGWHAEGSDDRDADRLRGSDGVWHHELADGAEMESDCQENGQLDLRQG